MKKIKVVSETATYGKYLFGDILFVRWTNKETGGVHASHQAGPQLTEDDCKRLYLPYLFSCEFVYLADEPGARIVSVSADMLLKALLPSDYPDDAGEARRQCFQLLLSRD